MNYLYLNNAKNLFAEGERICVHIAETDEARIMLKPIEKDNLKSIKTKNVLNTAILTLLEKYSFEKITVRDICEEALISRATFYAHFVDKYDFLKYCLMELVTKHTGQEQTYEQIAKVINNIIDEHKKAIRNLVRDARKETLDVLFEEILTTLDFPGEDKKDDERNIVVSNFYAGGMLFYLLWQVEHKFPQDIMPMNESLYEITRYFQTFLDKGSDGYG